MSDSTRKRTKHADGTKDLAPEQADTGESFKDQAVEAMSKAVEATKDVGRRAAGAVGGAYQATVAKGVAYEEGLERFVRRNPMTSILVTAGVSLLVGFMLGRETAKPPARPWWQPRFGN
jgi:ElaB/YqjD/DUF883 family membrane-anchored ribosome-binding protein